MKHNFSFLIKIIVCLSIISIISTSGFIYLLLNPREILMENKVTRKNSSNLISMMLETENGNYEESKDNAWPDAQYILNEKLSGCENGSKIIWNEKNQSVEVSAQSSDKCYLYFDHKIFTEYILNLYQKDGDNNLYYHDGIGAYSNSNLEAGDLSYRYSGSSTSVNNYICFGGACSNNPDDDGYKNLYRIIGLFKNKNDNYEIKIIKADSVTKNDLGDLSINNSSFNSEVPVNASYRGKLKYHSRYHWNNNLGTAEEDQNVNMWEESNLNKVNLNDFYYNSIKSPYKEMIAEHEWIVGGYEHSKSNFDAKTVYEAELGKDKLTTSDQKCYTQGNTTDARLCTENDLISTTNVGLMYVSDYMYGTLPEYWNTIASNYKNDEIKDNNWIYLGMYEWTISRVASTGNGIRRVDEDGMSCNANGVNTYLYLRPVLYLSSQVKIAGGLGTESNPYQLKM